jgi:hypothetical protein
MSKASNIIEQQAMQLAQSYLQNYSDDTFLITDELKPAYIYLAKTWLNWNEHLKIGDKKKKKALYKEAEIEEKFQSMFDGLTYYFREGNHMQEELIRINGAAATRVLLGISYLKLLDSNAGILNLSEQEQIEAIQGIIINLHPRTYVQPPTEIPEAVKQKIQATLVAESVAEKHNATDKLYEVIQDWVSGFDLDDKIIALEEASRSFQKGRANQTSILNQYDNQLENAKFSLKQYYDDNTMSDDLLDFYQTIEERQKALDLFRNVQLKELTAQIYEVPISEEDHRVHRTLLYKKEITAEMAEQLNENIPLFTSQSEEERPFVYIEKDANGSHKLVLNQLAADYRRSDFPAHPLVDNVNVMHNGVATTSQGAANSNHRTYGSRQMIFLRENGVKSWRRAIDKLVREKDGHWNQMKDIARINPLIETADDYYFYAKMVKQESEERGWKVKGDLTMKIRPTGSMSTFLKLHKKEAGITKWLETKIDDKGLSKYERLAHPIYKAMRLMQGDEPRFEFKAVTLSRFEELKKHLEKTVPWLENQTELKEVKDIKYHLSLLKEEINKIAYDDSDFDIKLNNLYMHCEACHFLIEAEAACNSHPTMAALHYMKVKEMFKAHEKGDNSAANLGQADMLRQLYEINGPVMGVHFSQKDLQHVEALESKAQTVQPERKRA